MKHENQDGLVVSRSAGGMKFVAVALSIIIYLAFVAYSEFHFWNLVTKFVPDEFKVIGLVAVGVSAFTAVALPLSLHFWFRQGPQWIIGLIFYVHFLIVMANLIVDGTLVSSGGTAAFANGIYATWILPAYIALYGVGWSVLWFLDDGSQRLDSLRNLQDVLTDGRIQRRITVTEMQGAALRKAFTSMGAQRAINRWAALNAPRLLAEELGMSVGELGEDGDYRFWLAEDEQSTLPLWLRNGHQSEYDLDQLLKRLHMTRRDAAQIFQSQGLNTPEKAYQRVKRYLPEGMTFDDFKSLYDELMLETAVNGAGPN